MARLLALLVPLALLVGCGGSDISKSAFTKKANKICSDGDKKLDTVGGSLQKSASEADVKKLVTDKVVPLVQKQFDDIRDLGFPKADKKKLDTIFDDSEAALKKVKDDPIAALKAGNPFKDVNSRLKAYGLTACGS